MSKLSALDLLSECLDVVDDDSVLVSLLVGSVSFELEGGLSSGRVDLDHSGDLESIADLGLESLRDVPGT